MQVFLNKIQQLMWRRTLILRLSAVNLNRGELKINQKKEAKK